jgi:xanthine dehydrogenase accessory factor
VEIDTHADEDLLSGSALGCRGRLRVALLPVHLMPGVDAVLGAWLRGGTTLERVVDRDGALALATDDTHKQWRLPASPPEWAGARTSWSLPLQRPPEALLLGAGPEAPFLLRLLHDLGWRTTLTERRPRWRAPDAPFDVQVEATPSVALAQGIRADVALVMHHNFELDREALDVLSSTPIPFVGLLGPRRRREDLFKLLSPLQRRSLEPRLRSPVGLDLGGRGPEAIALSIAAQLQAWRASAA